MKKIWDEQNNENIYAINESELHRRVIRKKNRVKRMINKFEWTLLIAMICIGLLTTIVGILNNQLYKLLDALIFFLVAGYIYKSRRDRIKYEGHSNLSLLDELEQTIRSLDYHAKRHKYFILWYMFPIFLTFILNATFYYSKPWWVWVGWLAFFSLAYWAIKKELRCKILPKKEDLLHLRSLLLKDD
ncbi:MAG: hypothetical protein WB779_16620 [Ignavibacteriaceae bacterium]